MMQNKAYSMRLIDVHTLTPQQLLQIQKEVPEKAYLQLINVWLRMAPQKTGEATRMKQH